MTDLIPANDLTARMNYAQALAASSLLPPSYRRQPANVLVAIEYGNALGLAPMVAIQTIHVVDGKPTASAQLIGSLVRRAGHRLRVTGDGKNATAEIVRSDDPDYTFRSEWTLDRAQAAGLLGKGVWKQYPDAMLKARAITEVARDACPEVLAGVAYTAEELGHDAPAPAAFVQPDEIVIEEENEEALAATPPHKEPTGKQKAFLTSQLLKAAQEFDLMMSPIAELDVLSDFVGRPLEFIDDLSMDEASRAIDDLKNGNEIKEILKTYQARRLEEL